MNGDDNADVIYHGYHHGSLSSGIVVVETDAGQHLGALHHVVWHSPTGLNWGYQGSGPADLARSLLIAALGDSARCPTCAATTKVINSSDAPPEDANDHRGPRYDPELVDRCPDCEHGYRPMPYHDFEKEYVAHWGNQRLMRRSDIQAWLITRHDFQESLSR
ncbi:MAG: DUF6166 domain-containing protein [Pseudonocardiaceae bacterium]